MILYKNDSEINLKTEVSKHKDILEVRGKILMLKIKLILVYFSVVHNEVDKHNNLEIKHEVEKKIEKVEDEALAIIGDFNGHIGILGEQRVDANGRIILEWINKYNLIILNCDSNCLGTYTWNSRNQRSVIDYILVNRKMYDHYKDMIIDENQEIIDVTDHSLIHARFMLSGETQTRTVGNC